METKPLPCFSFFSLPSKPCAVNSVNFDEKVYKPQSKSYGRIGANMQLFLHISYEHENLYQCIPFMGGPRDI